MMSCYASSDASTYKKLQQQSHDDETPEIPSTAPATCPTTTMRHPDKEVEVIDHDVNGHYCSKIVNNLSGIAALLVCGITAISLGASFILSSSSPREVRRVLSSTTATATAANDLIRSSNNRDLFLLSGQSNMVGHTTSSSSIGGNGDYWNKIKSILEQGGDLDTMEQKLYDVINETNYYNDEVATTLTNGVMDLYKSALLNDLDTPLMFGRCSFQEASDSKVDDVSQGTVPIVWNANCGHAFGHELLFSRTLELTMGYWSQYEMHKVARGGSSLFQHWYPNHGQHWDLLKQAIEEKRGQDGDWKGFIWHQGSQEAWSEEEYGEDRSLTYYGNLTGLVNEVRELMFQNSMAWQCKEEIPVVIVQVGYWPGSNAAAQRTRDAQARLCNEDPRAVLVKTDDLSRFYHFDAASFLISGNRIAHAYQEALGGVVECPDRVSSSLPSGIASEFPVTAPTADFSTSSHVCEGSNAKFFKLSINAGASSNTSWTLYDSSDSIVQSGSILDSGTEYVKRICVTPNSYSFEVSGIGEGCYEGYLRGKLTFEACGDGVHDFTVELELV